MSSFDNPCDESAKHHSRKEREVWVLPVYLTELWRGQNDKKMGKHSGKLKSEMRVRCMIILAPWDLATWTLGGHELLELNLPFIADPFPLLLCRFLRVGVMQTGGSFHPLLLSAQRCFTRSLAAWYSGGAGETGQHTAGERALG